MKRNKAIEMILGVAAGLALLCSPILVTSAFAADANVVEFHIAPGTGMGPWNTMDKPVVVHVGQTLRIFNDDTVEHFLHTSGRPCPHGTNPFEPGESYDCVISVPYDASLQEVYDHNYGPDSQFYIQANEN